MKKDRYRGTRRATESTAASVLYPLSADI